MNTTTTSYLVRRVASGAVLVAATALVSLGVPAVSHADAVPGMGCETVHWGFFGGDRRQICDGPQQADGSWQRTRTVYTPAKVLPLRCNTYGDVTSSYGQMIGNPSISCTGGYPVPQTTLNQESYVVTPATVLPDEPGWLSPGTDNIL
ncbi:hypothetical protein [Mycobacterium sp. NPDC006124]|uniref:CDGP domain-containing protein n=1 Tax=Mycobacterium sp. NPDC006124 TaxID=3156729 RepID=UPI0033A61DFF